MAHGLTEGYTARGWKTAEKGLVNSSSAVFQSLTLFLAGSDRDQVYTRPLHEEHTDIADMNVSQPTLHVLSDVLSFALILLAIGLPIRHLIKTRRFVSSVLRMWLYLFLWSLVMCVILPVILLFFLKDPGVFAYFPEMPGAAAVAFAGWMPSVIICGVVHSTHIAYRKVTGNQRMQTTGVPPP